MFHLTLLVILLLHLLQCLPVYFTDYPVSVQISSSRHRNQLQMVIAINGSIGDQIMLSTKAIVEPQHDQHILKLKQNDIEILPTLNDETIVFNYKIENQYLLAFTHKIGLSQQYFLPMQIQYKGIKRQFLLTIMDQKMTPIDKNSFCKCNNTLISVQKDKKNQKLYLHFFKFDKEYGIWKLDHQQNHEWRHFYNQIYFGGAIFQDILSNVKINLSKNKYCQVSLTQLCNNKNNGLYNNKRYYSVKGLLDLVVQRQKMQDIEQL